jgi:hypothetical protein
MYHFSMEKVLPSSHKRSYIFKYDPGLRDDRKRSRSAERLQRHRLLAGRPVLAGGRAALPHPAHAQSHHSRVAAPGPVVIKKAMSPCSV